MLGFAAAALCAALMGFAIQRGGTCLVAAIEEVVTKWRFTRLAALVEASVLVATGIVIAKLLHLLNMSPHAFALSGWTVLGGMIMGLGAYVAGACVFGAIARIGNGEASYLLVPAGFFLGCFTALRIGMARLPHVSDAPSPVLDHAPILLAPLLLLAGWRLWRSAQALYRGEFARYIWSPHVATSVIGVTFVILLLLAGSWNYTDYLAEAARHMSSRGTERGLLLLALFAGGLIGGWTAGRVRPVVPTLHSLSRCLVGGFLLGFGGSLVPGANDGLLLLGLPLFYPHAWGAFGSMLVTIAAVLVLEQKRRSLARMVRVA